MAFDYSKLCGRITEKYGTRSKFAKSVGISEHTISIRLTGKKPFKQAEIMKFCEVLDIPPARIPDYFFALKVQSN